MQYLTTVEVARLLGVSAETIRRWIEAGQLPAVRMAEGAWYRVSRKQLEQFAASKGIELDWTILEKSECPA